ncbi:MAG: DUF4091 domain-containing protein [Gammaproteobacteria bacterium]|nr:DUF4091 domain-containing protein [Gammaproteobacteria bacterium]
MIRVILLTLIGFVSIAAFAAPTVYWLENPVTDISIPAELPADWQSTQADTLSLAITPGEYRAASFLVIADQPLFDVLAEATDLVAVDGGAVIPAEQVDLRLVKQWYQAAYAARTANLTPRLLSELLLKDDALVKAEDNKNYLQLSTGEYVDISQRGQSRKRGIIPVDRMPVEDATDLQAIDIAAGNNRQFWVTVALPEAAEPGLYTSTIRVSTRGQEFSSLRLQVEVLPFRLASSDLVYSVFHRAQLNSNWPDGSISSEIRSEDQYSAELNNLVAHGVMHPNLYQKYNSPEFRRALELRVEAGIDQRDLFLIGLPAVPGSNEPVPFGFDNKIRDTMSKISDYEVDQLYMWGRDEAKAERLEQQKPVWNFSRDLGAKIFAAGYHTTAASGPGNFDLMGPLHDIFVAINPVTRQEAARWHSIDKKIFSYQNPTGGMERPETFRQNAGLFLWQMNYDGAMMYAYNDSFGSAWNDFDHAIYRDHNFVYPTVNGVVDTLQWEGLREGINDVRYLSTLMAMIEQSDNQSLVSEASAWLARLKEQPLARLDLDRVRAQFVGYILAFANDSDSVHQGLASGPIKVMADPAGLSYVEWTTNQRVAARIEYGSTSAAEDGQVSSGALMYEHRLLLPDLPPGKTIYVRAISNPGIGELLADVVSAQTQQLELQVVLSSDGNNDVLDINVDSVVAAHTLVDVDSSLLGWWRFAEGTGTTSKNLAGTAGTAELTGDAEWTAGYLDSGLALDGSGDFAYISDIETKEGSPVTIEAWVKFNQFALERGARQGIFTGLYQHQVNNHFYFSGKKALFEVSSLLKAGVWQHIVLTYAGTTASGVMYIDGQRVPVSAQSEIETIDGLDGLGVGRSSSFFGGLLSGGTTQLDGAVDEVRVWNRVLSDAEVQAAFGQASGRYRVAYPVTAGKVRNYKVISVNALGARAEKTVTAR